MKQIKQKIRPKSISFLFKVLYEMLSQRDSQEAQFYYIELSSGFKHVRYLLSDIFWDSLLLESLKPFQSISCWNNLGVASLLKGQTRGQIDFLNK